MTNNDTIVFCLRLKLPAKPTGDNIGSPWREALSAARPDGFEFHWNYEWPVDAAGYTWVPMYQSPNPAGVAYYMQRANDAERELIRLRESLVKLV